MNDLTQDVHTKGVYTVSQITREIKLLVESDFSSLWIEGEISNFKCHSSGHFYFSLKDADAQISCVMWRGRNASLIFQPEDGMKVMAFGNITLYERQGRYQLDVIRMRPTGIGELQAAFEALKQKLDAEGLFLSEYKQPIPAFPEKIGIVTSPAGAAIKDIISVIERRFPAVELILYPARVQGPGAAEEIVLGIQALNTLDDVDVIIVGRGGGSMEDLRPFNEETVARAIHASEIPVVSAVGHEIDFSVSDFVADLRAPTPSAAAELVVRDQVELRQQLAYWRSRMSQGLLGNIQWYRDKLETYTKHYGLRRPLDLIRDSRFHLDEISKQMENTFFTQLTEKQHGLKQQKARLFSLDPAAVLKRGFSITTRVSDSKVVSRAGELHPDEDISIRFYQGHIEGQVKRVNQS